MFTLLAACFADPAPPADVPVPEVVWQGSPAAPIGANAPIDADAAAARATELGWKPSADLDLSGSWSQRDDGAEGMRSELLLERRRVRDGLYRTRSVLIVSLDEREVVRVDVDAFEAIDAQQQCSFAQAATVSYAVEGTEELLAPLVNAFEPAAFNAEPCGRLVSVAADQIIGVHDHGATFHERRR
jgi:hypothetical protein